MKSGLTVKEYMEVHNKSISEMAALLGVLPNSVSNFIRSNKTTSFDSVMKAEELGIYIEYVGSFEEIEKLKQTNRENGERILMDWQIDILRKTGVTIVKKIFTEKQVEIYAKKSNLEVEVSDLNLPGDYPCYLVKVTGEAKTFV